MYNREHVTMYLLSPELVVGFRVVQVLSRLQKLYKLFPFFLSRYNNVYSRCPSGQAGRGTGNDTGSGTFEAQYETKDTCFGCKSRGNGWLGSLYDAPTFFLSISHSRDTFFSARVLRFVVPDRTNVYPSSNEKKFAQT